MTSYYFMKYPEISTKRIYIESQQILTQSNTNRIKTFGYVYGNNDRRDDNLRTKKGLSEKYGIDFNGHDNVFSLKGNNKEA